jgi:DNA invertase Pin-like site-specific DNA recombinase
MSLEVQRGQIQAYAVLIKAEVDEIVVEEGVSGSVSFCDRPRGGALSRRLVKGDVVIVPKLDRLFRSALDALQTVEGLKKRGVSLHLIDLGGDISGNGVAKIFLTIMAAVAEFERDRIRERISEGKARQKAEGKFLGGPRAPFGWRRATKEGDGLVEDPKGEHLVQHKAEQKAIREIMRLRKKGEPLRAISAAMKAKGHQLSHEGVAGVLRAASAN